MMIRREREGFVLVIGSAFVPPAAQRKKRLGIPWEKTETEILGEKYRNTGQKYRNTVAEIQKQWGINSEIMGQKYRNADNCSQRKKDWVVKKKERVIQRGKLSIIAKSKFTFCETENGAKGKNSEF